MKTKKLKGLTILCEKKRKKSTEKKLCGNESDKELEHIKKSLMKFFSLGHKVNQLNHFLKCFSSKRLKKQSARV